MPAELDTLNSELWSAYNTLGSRLLTFRNFFYALGTQIGDENWSAAETICNQIGDYVGTYVKPALCDSGGVKGKTYYALDWISDNWPTDGNGYELTMSKILAALWEAKPHQCLLFVPMIDAMRGSIMEKTVTLEWMGMALRHFRE